MGALAGPAACWGVGSAASSDASASGSVFRTGAGFGSATSVAPTASESASAFSVSAPSGSGALGPDTASTASSGDAATAGSGCSDRVGLSASILTGVSAWADGATTVGSAAAVSAVDSSGIGGLAAAFFVRRVLFRFEDFRGLGAASALAAPVSGADRAASGGLIWSAGKPWRLSRTRRSRSSMSRIRNR